jgi:mannose-6-phosphate isomerase-like protein (cupin superfamily)
VPIVHGTTAPVFSYTMPGVDAPAGRPHLVVRGLAAPSRGSTQTCVWRMTVAPQTPPRMGTVDHEEIFVVLTGRAVLHLDDGSHPADTGDALILPPDTWFGISNPHDEAVELMVVLPVGGRAHAPGQEPFVPPWAQ